MSNQGKTKEDYLVMVERELSRYEHPLFEWEAVPVDQGIQVIVRLKFAGIHDDPYRFLITPRELNARAFQWDFQRQLYNYLHDYLVEMFTRSPQIHEY
ncbi:MAG TPA: hypothetical protein VFM05_13665 [Candidatus Saccharimonadales bacterium]|nr:hypothetical protein [Candidatus Saccharimonadales bacterium]